MWRLRFEEKWMRAVTLGIEDQLEMEHISLVGERQDNKYHFGQSQVLTKVSEIK